jgi:flagellar basal-body rod protein FlgG
METESSGTPTTGNPDDDAFGGIEQGILENSNVDVVEEITRLITAQRAYEMNSKVIQTSDEMMSAVSNLR